MYVSQPWSLKSCTYCIIFELHDRCRDVFISIIYASDLQWPVRDGTQAKGQRSKLGQIPRFGLRKALKWYHIQPRIALAMGISAWFQSMLSVRWRTPYPRKNQGSEVWGYRGVTQDWPCEKPHTKHGTKTMFFPQRLRSIVSSRPNKTPECYDSADNHLETGTILSKRRPKHKGNIKPALRLRCRSAEMAAPQAKLFSMPLSSISTLHRHRQWYQTQ